MKPVKLTIPQWTNIREDLKKNHSPSVVLVRSRMREVLGFTDRSHREWVCETDGRSNAIGTYLPCVMLDFYDERKRTLFLLKYSEQINGKN